MRLPGAQLGPRRELCPATPRLRRRRAQSLRFDNGLTVGGAEFPVLDIIVSLHGMVSCTDSVLHVRASPRLPTSLAGEGNHMPTARAVPSLFLERTEVLLRLEAEDRVDLRVYDAGVCGQRES